MIGFFYPHSGDFQMWFNIIKALCQPCQEPTEWIERMTQHAQRRRDILIFSGLILIGALVAYLDHAFNMQTLLVEAIHAITVTILLICAIFCQRRYPEIRHVGWNKIVLGLIFLTIGSWVDLLDDPPTMALFQIMGVPFGRSWEEAFLKKILGYSAGILLIAYGFFQWIPWMFNTRSNVQKLNERLSQANQNMNQVLKSLDEHIESERLTISRELHDDVAQQLTFLNIQLQLCLKELQHAPEKVADRIKSISQQISETLKSVRQISSDLRPEPLYALGLIPALEQFVDKMRQQAPGVAIRLNNLQAETHTPIERQLDDRALFHLFRVLQEGIRNALKHSQASQIEVLIQEEPELFRFVVEDNGIGLPWENIPSDETLVKQGHLGIVGLKERVKELSGTFEMKNKPGDGAQMEIVIRK
jgi:signal transduction histidine kinase